MDFQSAMETFAEAWVAANTKPPLPHQPQPVSLAHQQEQQVGRVPASTPDTRFRDDTCHNFRSKSEVLQIRSYIV
ncbi:Hypothetical predicted protein [Cloeon dipterum]|uniref:Uncharacterized protein n=1 Tax=Cloeon dipterum TaxID=197152 RepID=A0A8S1E3L6_9INSE|nr:Hypothetical predicted protein [Cloeon dipterum]